MRTDARFIRIVLTLAFVMLTTTLSYAAVDGLSLLKLESGVQVAGMGGAGVAQSGMAELGMYNPASVSTVSDFDISIGHTSYWQDIRQENGFLAKRLTKNSVLHTRIRFGVISEIELRDRPSQEPIGIFDAHDIEFKAGVAFKLSQRYSVGFAAGWFLEKIGTYRGTEFNFDIGATALMNDRLSLGASIMNIGGELAISNSAGVVSRPIPLPTTYRVGGLYKYDRYKFVADIVSVDSKGHLHFGSNATVGKGLQVRAGYMTGYDTKSLSAGASFTRRNMTIDYAFVPFKRGLRDAHMFQFTFSL